jgi:hypothetical protein
MLWRGGQFFAVDGQVDQHFMDKKAVLMYQSEPLHNTLYGIGIHNFIHCSK